MNKALPIPIRTYHDLVLEEQRLTQLADWHKQQVKEDVQELKKQLAPLARIASFVNRIGGPVSNNPLLSAGLGMGAGLLVERAVKGARSVKWLAGIAGAAAPFIKKVAAGLAGRLLTKKPAGGR
jgi:hypothetical protein